MEGYIIRITPSDLYDGRSDDDGYAYFVKTSKSAKEALGCRIETAKLFLKEEDAISRAKREKNEYYSDNAEVLKVEVSVNILNKLW